MSERNPHTELPDSVLVTGYKEYGNQEYLVALYQRYAGLLFGVCLKYLRNASDARDACTEIYEILVTRLLKHEVENFKGWLHVVAKNHCLQKLRAAKNITISKLPEDFVQLEDHSHLEEVVKMESNFKLMEKCLEELGDEQQAMVKLFYLEEKCYNDIVAITGKPWNTVRSHIQNGRRNLKNCMENSDSE